MTPSSKESWPTRVSPIHRTLLDQHAQPWLGVGDTAWSLIGQLSDAQIIRYLDNRAAKGVNLVLVSAPEAYYADRAPLNTDGDPPFTGQAFRSPMSDAYWARLDRTLDQAATRGITLLICPMYTGWGKDGWAEHLRAATVEDMGRYGAELAGRYSSRRNVLWLLGHDMQNLEPALKARGKALADALRSGAPHLITAASNRSRDDGSLGIGSEEWAGSGVRLDFDTQYDYSGAPGRNAAVLWSLEPPRPFLFLEGVYEQEVPGPLPAGDVLLRRQLWGPFANGATAVLFGNNPVWGLGTRRLYTPYNGTWEENLDGPGSGYLAVFARLTPQIGPAWGATVADTTAKLVRNPGSGARQVSVRYSPTLAIIYHPDFASEPLEIDLAALGSAAPPLSVRVYDPASGVESLCTTHADKDRFLLASPGANSKGDRDWVIVIR